MENLRSYEQYNNIDEGFKEALGIGSGKFNNAIAKFKKEYKNIPEVLDLLTKETEEKLKADAKKENYDVRILPNEKGELQAYSVKRGSSTTQGKVGGTAG